MTTFTPWATIPATQRATHAPEVLDWLQSIEVTSITPLHRRATYNRANYLRRKLRQRDGLAELASPPAAWFGLSPEGPCWHPQLGAQPADVLTRAYLRLLEELTR